MKSEQFFIGNVKRCTKYEAHTTLHCETYINGQSIGGEGFGYVKIEDEIFKENAILIKSWIIFLFIHFFYLNIYGFWK